jgi:hypothetical protein
MSIAGGSAMSNIILEKQFDNSCKVQYLHTLGQSKSNMSIPKEN